MNLRLRLYPLAILLNDKKVFIIQKIFIIFDKSAVKVSRYRLASNKLTLLLER